MDTSRDVHYYDLSSKVKGVTKAALLYFGVPYLAICSVFLYLAVSNRNNPTDLLWFSCYSISLCLICFITFKIWSFNKNNYFTLREAFTLEGRFEPQMELHTRSYSEYLGLDTQNGTIVYFWSVNNKEHLISRDMLAVGFTNYNWRKCELHGNKLVIYTHDPKIPYIEFTHSRAPALYERLCAMQRLDFSYDVNFPGWIDFQAKQVAEELNLNLITVKS